MRSYFKVWRNFDGTFHTLSADGASGGEIMAMVSSHKNDAIQFYNQMSFFEQFARIDCYLQQNLDNFNQCVIDNGDPDCTLTAASSFTGSGLWQMITEAYRLIPYSEHPLD